MCRPESICAGITEHLLGSCTPVEHQGSFTNSVATPIPEDDSVGVEIDNDVAGVPGFVADVIIEARIDHPSPRDVVISVVSPSETESIIWNREADKFPRRLQRPAWGFGGEGKLRVIDDVLGNRGEVDHWTISIVTSL